MRRRTKLAACMFALGLMIAVPSNMSVKAAEDVAINETNFPDAVFRTYVTESFDTNQDGLLSTSEITAATVIDITDNQLESMEGIKNFSELKELYCHSSELTKLDLGFNKLEVMDFSDCVNLETLESQNGKDNGDYLKNYNISNCSKLKNWDQTGYSIQSANFSGCTQIEGFEYNAAVGSDGEAFDFSGCTSLKSLDFEYAHSLKTLNISGCSALTELNCTGTKIDKLDLSDCSELKVLIFQDNDMVDLDVSKCSKLELLYCGVSEGDYNESYSRDCLHSINLAGCSELKEFYGNHATFTKLDFSACPKIETISCSDNNITEIKLSSACENLVNLDCSDNQLRDLDLSGCTKLKYLSCGLNNLTELKVGNPQALLGLWAKRNHLPSETFEQFTNVHDLNCSDNGLDKIDLTKFNNLYDVDCSYNEITELNLNQKELVSLICENNKIKVLDLKNCPKLERLYCSNNQITSLDLKNCPKLWELNCSNNQITSLDLQYCKKISNALFKCDDNVLETNFSDNGFLPKGIDLTKVKELQGATIKDGKLVPNKGVSEISYKYDVNNTIIKKSKWPTFTIKRKVHNHEYSDEWRSDGKKHWHECACGDKKNVQSHKNEKKVTAATLTKNGKVENVCDICEHRTKIETIYYPKQIGFASEKYEYTGKVLNPAVIVKDSKGNKIDKKYYTVKKASGRKNVGKYIYKITFKDKYEGVKSVSFKISPKKIKIKSLTAVKRGFKITWNKHLKQTTGYSIRYSEKSDMSYSKYLNVEKNTKTSKTISKLAANTEYFVQLRTYKEVNGKKYYSDWSKTKQVVTK